VISARDGEAADKRFRFIQNKEAVLKGGFPTQVVEFEVDADAETVGEYKVGPYGLTIWDFGIFERGEARKLCLSVERSRFFDRDEPPNLVLAPSGFGIIADEIVSCASVLLRRRLRLGLITRVENRPQRSLYWKKGWLDAALVEGKTNLTTLSGSFALLERLMPDKQPLFILAARLYNRALQTIEEEPDMAYLHLVSTIEVLCQDTPIKRPPLDEVDSRLASILEQIPDATIREKLSEAILVKERFIGRKFVAFVMSHVEDGFWIDDSRPKEDRIDQTDLPQLLENVYKQRSLTLHAGARLPPYVFRPPGQGAEIERASAVGTIDGWHEKKDYIPLPHFFERLVNHVLNAYLKRNQTSAA
jgi:hypothetical protein